MTHALVVTCCLLALASASSGQNPTGETATPTRPRFATLSPMYFTVNSSAFSDSARATLRSTAEILKANPAAGIIVVGHTDERGAVAYNERLGLRRAQAVAAFLAANGVSAARVRIISAGEREPIDMGHDASAWGRNRRVELRVKDNVPLRMPR